MDLGAYLLIPRKANNELKERAQATFTAMPAPHSRAEVRWSGDVNTREAAAGFQPGPAPSQKLQ